MAGSERAVNWHIYQRVIQPRRDLVGRVLCIRQPDPAPTERLHRPQVGEALAAAIRFVNERQ